MKTVIDSLAWVKCKPPVIESPDEALTNKSIGGLAACEDWLSSRAIECLVGHDWPYAPESSILRHGNFDTLIVGSDFPSDICDDRAIHVDHMCGIIGLNFSGKPSRNYDSVLDAFNHLTSAFVIHYGDFAPRAFKVTGLSGAACRFALNHTP